jgi:hypothetical protein
MGIAEGRRATRTSFCATPTSLFTGPWQRQGHQITVSINVSAKRLDRDQIVSDVHNALTMSDFDPAMCVLELTETTLMHNVEDTVDRIDSCSTPLAIPLPSRPCSERRICPFREPTPIIGLNADWLSLVVVN